MLSFKNMVPDPGQGQATAPVTPVLQMTPQDGLFVQIEGFTKNDFNTDDPYLFILNSHNSDEVLFTRLKNKLFDQAKLVKYPVSDAKKQMQAIEHKNHALLPSTASGSVAVNGFSDMDQFFGQSTVQYGSYSCNDNGITGTTPQGVPMTICKHPIFISKRYANVLSNVETVDITYYQDGQYKTIRQIPRADISSAQKIVPILASRGVNITSETAKGIVNFLSDFDAMNRDIIPRSRTTDTIGWMPDGTFVPFDGDIEVDAMSSDRALSNMSSALHTKGDPAIWMDAVKNLRKSKDSIPIRMMLAASFASVLVEPMGRLPGWIHMVGKGTSGKTISLRLAASVWGKNEVSDGWMRNMNATKVGMEVLAGFAHNLPLCLNELQTIQNLKDFDDLVYTLVECSGKTRGAAGGGLRKSYSWRLFIISCGEMQIVTEASREGANSRVVEIMVDHMLYGDPEKGEPQKFCSDVLDKSYGHAGKMFIEGLKHEDMNALTTEFVQITSDLTKAGKAPKQADTAALMMIADKLAEKYIFKDGVVLEQKDILDYLKDQDMIDDNKKAWEAVKSLVSENLNNFSVERIVKYGDTEKVEITEPKGRVWGKIADNGDTVMIDQRIFNQAMKDMGYDASRTIKWCLEHKLVEDGHTDCHTSATKQKRFITGGPKVWSYVFYVNKEETGHTEVNVSQEELPF